MARGKHSTRRVTLSNGNSYDIPVGEDGYVPPSALLKRFNNRYAGVRPGRKRRDLVKDYDSYADVVLPEKVTPEQAAAWWDCPANYDIEGIDTPGRAKVRNGIRYHGTQAEVVKMDQMMRATNDPKELERIRKQDTVYSARPLKRGVAGQYTPSKNKIDLDRRVGMDHQTISHETTHMVRDRDKGRRSILTKRNASVNVEESCTVAEQMARSRAVDYTGYYMHVPVFDEEKRRWRNPTPYEASRMAEEDFMIMTYGRGKPLKGKEARKSVEENWTRTNIARLRHNGKGAMAITTLANQHSSFKKAGKDIEKYGKVRPKKERKRGGKGKKG